MALAAVSPHEVWPADRKTLVVIPAARTSPAAAPIIEKAISALSKRDRFDVSHIDALAARLDLDTFATLRSCTTWRCRFAPLRAAGAHYALELSAQKKGAGWVVVYELVSVKGRRLMREGSEFLVGEGGAALAEVPELIDEILARPGSEPAENSGDPPARSTAAGGARFPDRAAAPSQPTTPVGSADISGASQPAPMAEPSEPRSESSSVSGSPGRIRQIAVLPVKSDAATSEGLPDVIDDYLLEAVERISGASVIGTQDLTAMLSLEKQKSLFGCDDSSCMAELGGALGVDHMLSVIVSRVGNEWALSAKLIDLKNVSVEARQSDFVPGSSAVLLKQLPRTVVALFGQVGQVERGPRRATTYASADPRLARAPDGLLVDMCTDAENGHACAVLQSRGRLDRIGRAPRVWGWIMLAVGVAGIAVGIPFHGESDEEGAVGVLGLILGSVATLTAAILLPYGYISVSNAEDRASAVTHPRTGEAPR